MSSMTRLVAFTVAGLAAGMLFAPAQEPKPYAGPACAAALDDYFTREVWPKVGAAHCVTCHKAGGDAEKSKLVLRDPAREPNQHARDDALRHNRDAFAKLATAKYRDEYRLLVKVAGGLSHGGAEVLAPDSKGYAVLAEFGRRVNAPSWHQVEHLPPV